MKKWIAILMMVFVLSTVPLSVWADGELTVTISIPYADTDQNTLNDYVLEFGTLNNYYVYSYDTPTQKTVEGESEILTFSVESEKSYFYRVSNLLNTDVVTYGNYLKATENMNITISKENLLEGENTPDRDTVKRTLENPYDVADIYLNINEKGHLRLNSNETYVIYPLRNWLAIEGIQNAKTIQPNFYYEILELEGENVISIDEIIEDNNGKHGFVITANAPGTALVQVGYYAMQNAVGMGGNTFYSAIWPENKGVFIVTVDNENQVTVETNLNTGRNMVSNKLSGDAIDSELDVLYYTGEEGATYTVENINQVSLSTLSVMNETSFSTDKIRDNSDGTKTVTGLTEGTHVLKIQTNDAVAYQVIRAKKTGYTLSFTRDGEPVEDESVQPGDTVTIQFDRLYHPVNKLSGVYNSSAKISYIGSDGSEIYGTANQYQFAANEAAQTIMFTIPENWSEETYTLQQGALLTSGYSSAFGAHRAITYTEGKAVNFSAVANASYLGSLPDIIIPVSHPLQLVSGSITIQDVNGIEITDADVGLKDAEEQVVPVDEHGSFTVLPGVYTYTVSAQGYETKTGTFTAAEGENEWIIELEEQLADMCITVSAYDHTAVAANAENASETGVILENAQISMPVGTTAEDVVKAVFDANQIPYILENGYISSINGLGAGAGYSGWCLNYNNDDYQNMGMSSLTLNDGDHLRFDYSCNYDTTTDDIGNGWYGLPIVTEIKIGGETIGMKKVILYTEKGADIQYYLLRNNQEAVLAEGAGTENDPFILPVTVANGTDFSKLSPEIKTSLHQNYCIISGIENADFNNPVFFSISSLGGLNNAKFKLVVSEAKDENGNIPTKPKTIRVSFRLIGATLAEQDVDLSKGLDGYYGSEYRVWRKTKAYTIKNGDTVYDLFKLAMESSGMKYDDSNGYISGIEAPKAVGKYFLRELDNGAYSGWMYTVNGEYGQEAITEHKLNSGDVVIFHYVNDYRYEIPGWSGVDDKPLLGDGTLTQKWLDVRDKNPSSVNVIDVTENKQEEMQEENQEENQEETAKEKYRDVDENEWYYAGVSYVMNKGYMKGTSENIFEPNTEMTRAMLVTVLYRISGEPEQTVVQNFDDVLVGSWYEKAVTWANRSGIVYGYNQSKFGSDDFVTREQLAVLLYRYAEKQGMLLERSTKLDKFEDASDVSDYAKVALKWAVSEGIVQGVTDTKLSPAGHATRAQIATILMRFLVNQE